MCGQKPRSTLKTSLSSRAVHPRQSRFAACGYFGDARCPRIQSQKFIQSPYTPFRLTSIQFYPQWFRRALFCPSPKLYAPEPLPIESLGLGRYFFKSACQLRTTVMGVWVFCP